MKKAQGEDGTSAQERIKYRIDGEIWRDGETDIAHANQVKATTT